MSLEPTTPAQEDSLKEIPEKPIISTNFSQSEACSNNEQRLRSFLPSFLQLFANSLGLLMLVFRSDFLLQSNSNISETEGTSQFFAYIEICILLSPNRRDRGFPSLILKFRLYWNSTVSLLLLFLLPLSYHF